jgi:ribosomal protein L37AE/L43A
LTEYQEDLKFLEKILKEKKCPYCDYSLRKPYQAKRECKRCDFTLYGNPKLVAFKTKEPSFDWSIKEDHCPECQSTDLFYEEDQRELVCLGCGLVLKGSNYYCTYIKIDYPFGHFIDLNYTSREPSPVYIDEETTWTEDPIKR